MQRGGRHEIDVMHHVITRHQVAIEIWPPRGEVHFRDDRAVNPINTQVRFEAKLYNTASSAAVQWDVLNTAGNPGAGSVDASGLYRAPNKGTLPSGHTDIVVATAVEDPLRKAFAWVTLVGVGPAPAPQPSILIWPRLAYVYYPDNASPSDRNEFIDASNTRQLFQATLRDAPSSNVEWLVDGALQANSPPTAAFRYDVPGSGTTKTVVVTARLAADHAVKDEAKVVQINYRWPRMRPVSDL